MTGKEALGVFSRTFLVLAGSTLVAVQGLEWADKTLIGDNALTLGLGLLSAFVGGLLAVGAAYLIRPSASTFSSAARTASVWWPSPNSPTSSPSVSCYPRCSSRRRSASSSRTSRWSPHRALRPEGGAHE